MDFVHMGKIEMLWSGILVEQGTYSITIPSGGQQPQPQSQQQVIYTQPQQTVYTAPQPVQQRVVYSPQQQHQQVFQVGPPHPQQVVFAGSTAVKQQPAQAQHPQQILLHQQLTQQQLLQQQPQQFVSTPNQRLQQQQQQSQQQVQQLPLQQHQQPQQLIQQGPAQLQQHLVLQQQQLVSQQPQLQQQQLLQAGQQSSQQITFIEHRLEDEKGCMHIVRTPISVSNVRTKSPVQVGGQTALTQSTPLLPTHPSSHHASAVLGGPGLRAATPQPATSVAVASTRTQGPRLQRNSPLQRYPTPVLQQQQQQDEQQASYQDQFLKQIENRIQTQQKTSGRAKVNNPNTTQQRRMLSQQLGNQQQKQQVAGVHVSQSLISGVTNFQSTAASSQPQQQEHQQQKQTTIQNTSPTKKLSLKQYRKRVSEDLKQQQQQQKLVAQIQARAPNEEVRIPLAVNNQLKQQYLYVQQSNGKKVLAVVPLSQTVTTAVSQQAPTSTLTTSVTFRGNLKCFSSRTPQFITSSAGSNPVFTVKHEDEVLMSGIPPGSKLQSPSSSSTSSLSSTSIAVSSSGIASTNSSTSPPIQEQTVHSTISSEQTDKGPADKPRFIAGRIAVCTNCGILSEDLNRCQRCNRRLPDHVRTVSSTTTTTTSTKTSTCDSVAISNRGISLSSHFTKQEFYGKTGGGARKGVEKKSASPSAQKSKGRGRGRGKTYEEPVILTLSSDEEEDDKKSGVGSAATGGSSNSPPEGFQLGPPEPISHKEPIITADMENFDDVEEADTGGAVTGGGLPDLQSLLDGTLKGPYTSLQCRSIRVGSYKVMPKDRVLIVPQGLRLKIPPITEDSSDSVTFDIPIKSIIKILAHFGRSLPVLFIYIKPSTAASIRRLLKMTDKTGHYFDPCSYDESQKRITILPDRLTEENKNLVKEILSPTNLQTSNVCTTSAYVGALATTVTNHSFFLLNVPHRGFVHTKKLVQSLVKKPVAAPTTNESKMLLIYPPPPQKGGISISTDDYCCLEEEQFLNDVIIDFYLKWLLQSKLSDVHRVHTHVFSTFFYKRLTSKPKKRRLNAPEDDPKLTAAEKRHTRVKSWTKNVDIFSKDFIIIPINEHAHWFLAIICFPGLDGPVRMSDGQPVPLPVPDKSKRRRSTRPKNRIEVRESQQINDDGREINTRKKNRFNIRIPVIDDGEWSDRDEAEGDEDELEEDEEEDEETPPNKKSKVEEPGPGETQTIKTETPSTIKHNILIDVTQAVGEGFLIVTS
ncbi:putative mediator of RNA polymerase II transcription subunit 26 [Homarus americanus]|uniref:putative mediator of RNA polymerase II transcription subunit 26 n=1 Tax=Homarus americanus TaxID=6706 RepID=UPI001C4949BF|nr:putative mediator of RNA polymerase II transcription subunit 26 [Homarus americanus]